MGSSSRRGETKRPPADEPIGYRESAFLDFAKLCHVENIAKLALREGRAMKDGWKLFSVLAALLVVAAVWITAEFIGKTQPEPTFHRLVFVKAPAATASIDGKNNAPSIDGENNTISSRAPYSIKGSGNTVVGPTDANGNTIMNKGGIAIGAGAKADSTSVAIGAGARVDP